MAVLCARSYSQAHIPGRVPHVRTSVHGPKTTGRSPISANLSRMSFVKLPQNRHPERSASQIDCVTHRLWRGVEGPRRCYLTHAVRSFSTTEPAPGGPRRSLPGTENQELASILLCPAPTSTFSEDVPVTIKCVSHQILFSGFGGRKARNSMSKISTAGVLRLRATSAVSRNQSVRRSAQDDDSVGV
jgi:hypothetical protein